MDVTQIDSPMEVGSLSFIIYVLFFFWFRLAMKKNMFSFRGTTMKGRI